MSLPSVREYSHSRQAKVNDLDLVGESAHTEDVFWLEFRRETRRCEDIVDPHLTKKKVRLKACYLEVQVQDIHFVHVLQAFTDLPDEHDGVQLH